MACFFTLFSQGGNTVARFAWNQQVANWPPQLDKLKLRLGKDHTAMADQLS